jgi:hypothetical protein
MKKVYQLALTMVLAGSSIVAFSQSALPMSGLHRVKDIPKLNFNPNANARYSNSQVPVVLNYVQSDSNLWTPSYGMHFIFNFNSRYTLADSSSAAGRNYFLLRYFGVVYDTMLDALTNTTTPQAHVQSIHIDSVFVILGQANTSTTNDTIIVCIDSVSKTGWPVKVLHSDTTITSSGMSSGNNWYSAFYLIAKPNYTVNNKRFGIFVYYYGSKLDTCGFLPGWPYQSCTSPAGNFPADTYIGMGANPNTWNSMTNGFQYYYKTKPVTLLGSETDSLWYQCNSPSFKGLLYFQDNPITAYCTLNVNGVNEVKSNGLSVSQNFPNPFNQATQIKYNLTKSSNVVFTVYDLTGRQLVNTNYNDQAAGDHFITLNANQLTPGIYFYSFNVNGNVITQKMIVTQ